MVGTFYKVRYKGPGGNQVEESGFLTQDEAIDRLTNTYKAKKASPANRARSERIEKCGQMRLREYTALWRAGQRHLAAASLSHLDSLLQHHVFPALATRRMSAFDHNVVDGFIRTMERNGVGLAAQSNAYDKLKSILLDAVRSGTPGGDRRWQGSESGLCSGQSPRQPSRHGTCNGTIGDPPAR
ncbi:hypothetical protein [Streptomyces erythrochromogenes]|uniref:hypothetical protein n=1 Tax=Streptomyces erythrochromogenes TaxID=285574 RepID=UPI0038137619